MYIWTKLQRQVPLHFKKNWRKFAAWSFWKSESHLNKWPRFEVLWRLYIRPVILRIFSLKWELIATVSKLSFYHSIWWIEYTVKSLQKSVQGKIDKFMSKLCYAAMRQNFALKLFKVKAPWKQIEKCEHFIKKSTKIRQRHLYKNQISLTGTPFNKTSPHQNYTSTLLISIYDIQKFWRHLIQFEITIGNLSSQQPIHIH